MACTIEDLNPPVPILGCTDPLASNYNPDANIEDCSCQYDLCPTGFTISEEGIVLVNNNNTPNPSNPIDNSNNNEPITTRGTRLSRSGSGSSGDGIGTSNLDFLENEDCCNSETVGQDVFWDGEFCRLVNSTGCPPNLAITLNGLLINGDTGEPVSQLCCGNSPGFTYFPGGAGTVEGCFQDGFTPDEPCELTLEDIIYVGNTVVYDASLPPTGSSGDIIGEDNLEEEDTGGGTGDTGGGTGDTGGGTGDGGDNTGGNGEPDVDASLGCFNVQSWGRGRVDSDFSVADSLGPELVGYEDSNGVFYGVGTYLFVINISTANLLPAEEDALIGPNGYQVGDTLDIYDLNPAVSVPAYYPSINDTLNQDSQTSLLNPPLTKIALLSYDSFAENLKIATEIVITDDTDSFSSIGSTVPSPDGVSCKVFEGGSRSTSTTNTETGNRESNSCTADCGTQIGEFTTYTFQQPVLANDSIIPGSPLNTFWSVDNNTVDVCGEIFNSDVFLLSVDIGALSEQYGFNIPYSNQICIEVNLNQCFWDNLANSCYAPYIIGGTRPRTLKIIGRDGISGDLYLNLAIPFSDATFVGLGFNPSNSCGTSQSSLYYLCETSPGLVIQNGTLSNNTTRSIVSVDKDGKPLTINEISNTFNTSGQPKLNPTPVPASRIDPCEEPITVVPEPPSSDNNFSNLSEDCCLRLGAELGWEFIDGVCFWNPPTPITTTEFGLSESDIIVEDLECPELTISSYFYLERPDDVNCEPDSSNDIVASLVVYTGDSLNNTVIQTSVVQTFNLSNDGYCQWTQLSSTITNDFNTPFKIKLVLSGIKECCEYDIFVDDIQVICNKQDTIPFATYSVCPGFNLKRVVDNKKSWVKNVETPINRVFAPSPDANLPWRYTNYVEQSGVYENDSRLVLNSKELDVIFNMKRRKNPCPDGYNYDPNSDNCFRAEVTCPDGFTISGGTCVSGATTTSATTVTTTFVNRNPESCNIDLSIYDLIDYKRNFQNFWVKFIEQFIPATTIFVSGEKWSNRDDEICPTIEECGYDNLFTKEQLGLEETGGGLDEAVENRNTNIVSPVITSDDKVNSDRNGDYGTNDGKEPIIMDNFVGSFIERDESILKEGPLTLKRGELNLLKEGKKEYQDRLRNRIYLFNP